MKQFFIALVGTMAILTAVATPLLYLNYQDFQGIIHTADGKPSIVATMGNAMFQKQLDRCDAEHSLEACIFTVRYNLAGSPHFEASATPVEAVASEATVTPVTHHRSFQRALPPTETNNWPTR